MSFLKVIARSISLSTYVEAWAASVSSNTSASHVRTALVICVPYSPPGSMESGAIQQSMPLASSKLRTACACADSSLL